MRLRFETYSKSSIRTIPVPKQTVDLLILEHEKHPDNPYMFPSPKTGTMGAYAHVTTQAQRQAADTMGNILSGAVWN